MASYPSPRANVFQTRGNRPPVWFWTLFGMKCTFGVLIAGSFLAGALAPLANIFAQEKSAADGTVLFAANCGVCHGSDGRSGERASNIAARREIVSLSDESLIRIVENGVPGQGMPS